jgi:hypothetical protein
MIDPGIPNPPRIRHSACDHAACNDPMDHWVAMNRHGLHAFTRMMKGLACHEPYSTLSESYVELWRCFFAWSKEMQTLPGFGGGGKRGGGKGVVGANAGPVVVTATANRAVRVPIHATAFVNEDGVKFPGQIVPVAATPVVGPPPSTTITITFTPPTGTPAGSYGGSILTDTYRLVVGPIQVDIPAG